MLITTGKNPCSLSKEIARALYLAVPCSRLEFRGKRSLSQLLEKARKYRMQRICSLYCSNGKPAQLSFISIDDEGNWQRLSPKIAIRKAEAKIPKGARQPSCLKITGSRARVLAGLIAPANVPDSEPESSIQASATGISLSLGREKILSLGVEYEE